MEITIFVRRYQCQRCDATMTTGPAGVLPRYLFSAAAIGLALALWAGGATGKDVRKEVSPWRIVGTTASTRWNSLRRWARAAGKGELWPRIQTNAQWELRAIAKRVAAVLMNRGPPNDCDEARVFAGAALLL